MYIQYRKLIICKNLKNNLKDHYLKITDIFVFCSLVWFDSISTSVGYLIPNSVFTYTCTLNIYDFQKHFIDTIN